MYVQKLANSQLNLPHGTKPNEERVMEKLKTTRRPASADRTARRQFQAGLRGDVGL